MTSQFDDLVQKIQEDFNVQKRALLPRTFQGPGIDWGKTATHPSGFKGDSFNPASTEIIFAIPAKKKKKSLKLKKRVAANRIGR